MTIILYHWPISPPSRTVLAVSKAIGIDVTVKHVELYEKEHLSEEYRKINPEHTVPTIDDHGFILHESHVIATYLVSRYGKDDSLYPKDVTKRALVDQRLYFNATILFPRIKNTTTPIIFFGKRNVDADAKAAIYEALEVLEKYLEPTGWVAVDHPTVADICCSVTAGSMKALGVDFSAYPKICGWLKRCESTFRGYEDAVQQGEKEYADAIEKLMGPNVYAR